MQKSVRTNAKSSKSSTNSTLNNGPSDRSRNSVIKGSRAFVWDREKARSDQPYFDGTYHTGFDRPPNEVNFLGGLGTKRGNARSKLHPNRPTMVQKLYNMRHRNRIAVTFTQAPSESHCLVQPKKVVPKDPSSKAIDEMVKRIVSADFKESPHSSDVSDVSEIVQKMKRKPKLSIVKSEDNKINGVPFYYSGDEIRKRTQTFIDRNVERIEEIPKKDEDNLREWALDLRKENEIRYPDESSPTADKQSTITKSSKSGSRSFQAARIRSKDVIKHITGYMYGPFTEPPTSDKLTKNGNKFNIPNTMLNRVKRHRKKQKIQENILRRVRLTHMGFAQPPSKEESSDDESIQKVKRLALVRTPYCIIPTIKYSRVKKRNRFRNKYLKGDRLRRINMYLNEKTIVKHRTRPDEFSVVEKVAGAKKTKSQSVIAKFMQMVTRKGSRDSKRQQEEQSGKSKYLQLIRRKFLEQREKCEFKNKTKKPMTFAEYKAQLGTEDDAATTVGSGTEDKSEVPSIRSMSLSAILKKTEPEELFKRKKNPKLSLYDNIIGPFYTDPKLMDKFRVPKKFGQPHKYYTSLIKGKHFIRDRLQVNVPDFEEEQIGEKNKYFSRMATEWDNFYIHELRHRRPAKKFNVKTDILAIKDITRKNYIIYCVQENLLFLRACQRAEKKLMDDIVEFTKICGALFITWRADAFKVVTEKNMILEEIIKENEILKIKKKELDEKFMKINKDIFVVEQEFNYLMKIQNYYYMLQNDEWRTEHDWIHRNENNETLHILNAFKGCATQNIRPNSDLSCAHSIREFYINHLLPNMEKMRAIKPDVNLMKSSLEHLKEKTFNCVMQHNRTFWLYKQIYNIFRKTISELDEERLKSGEFIGVILKKRIFMDQRAIDLQKNTNKLINKDLRKALKNPIERKIFAICDNLYRKFVPQNELHLDLIDATTSMNKFEFIHELALDLLGQLDTIPVDILKRSIKIAKNKKRMIDEQTKAATIKQKRFELLKKQLINQFTPTAKFKRVTVITNKVAKAN